MTADQLFPVTFDEAKGRAIVQLSGTIDAARIGRTFLAITLNAAWHGGERSIVWQMMDAHIPDSFAFAEVLRTAERVKHLTRPGRSAIVVTRDSPAEKTLAQFYRDLGEALTPRRIQIFTSLQEAHAWLDS
jgi:hypothetical protein